MTLPTDEVIETARDLLAATAIGFRRACRRIAEHDARLASCAPRYEEMSAEAVKASVLA